MAGNKTRSLIQFVVLLSIGVLLIWLSLREVAPQKDKILDAFASANYFWIGMCMIIAFISHLLRAYRWNYLLEPLGYKVDLVNSICHVLVGYFANYGIPRMGEVTRCSLAARYDKVPFEVAFGTVITERIVDFFLFFLIFILTLAFQFSQLIGLAKKLVFDPLSKKLQGIAGQPVKLAILILGFAAIVVLFYFLRKKASVIFRGKIGNLLK